MQIYKYMNIGTAKPTVEEMDGVPHHMLDFLEPDQSFSVADYVVEAGRIINDIYSRGKMPVLAGGTGLYISSLINGVHFSEMRSDDKLRKELENTAAQKGAEYMHKTLEKIDPELAKKLHPNDMGRIIRAIEVFRLTGITMSEQQRQSLAKPPVYNALLIGLTFSDRQALYNRINRRVDIMLESGLLEEARMLGDKYSRTASQAIGYKELSLYLKGQETPEDAKEKIKQETRRYAKRQLTWFRRNEKINWFDMQEENAAEKMTAMAITFTAANKVF